MYLLPAIARRQKRKTLFAVRPVRSFEQWCQEFYPANGFDKELSRKVPEALGKELGIQPTRVYPTDRFDKELKLRWLGRPIWYLERLELLIQDLFNENHIKLPEDVPFVNSVGEVIAQLQSHFKQVREEKECIVNPDELIS